MSDWIAKVEEFRDECIEEVRRLKKTDPTAAQESMNMAKGADYCLAQYWASQNGETKMSIQDEAIQAVLDERHRQDKKWGEQNHLPQFWTGILGEEYGELCEAINETVFDNGSDKGGYENMRREAIHVAAVAVGFLECLERNKSAWEA